MRVTWIFSVPNCVQQLVVKVMILWLDDPLDKSWASVAMSFTVLLQPPAQGQFKSISRPCMLIHVNNILHNTCTRMNVQSPVLIDRVVKSRCVLQNNKPLDIRSFAVSADLKRNSHVLNVFPTQKDFAHYILGPH